MRLSSEDRERLAALWLQGVSSFDIAKALSISDATVRYHAKKQGLAPHQKAAKPLTEAEMKALEALRSGKTIREAAIGVAKSRLWVLAKREGISLTLERADKKQMASIRDALQKSFSPTATNAELAAIIGTDVAAVKRLKRELGLALKGEDLREALSRASLRSAEVQRANDYAFRRGPMSRGAVERRAATRRLREANRHGFASPMERYEALARSRGGTVSGVAGSINDDLTWACAKNHSWLAPPKNILAGQAWCPRCANVGPSAPQLEIEAYVKELLPGVEVLTGDRVAIAPKELDIYIPSLKVAIEYDGLLFHSDFHQDIRGRHAAKAAACARAGVKLFAIYGDEWENRRPLVKSMIRWRLGVFSGQTHRASELRLAPVESGVAKAFFSEHHLDGHARASKTLGLFAGDELIQAVSLRRNFNREFEVCRMATHMEHRVHGGAAKLLKALAATITGPLYTFSNNRIGDGSVYGVCGFTLIKDCPPSYYYTDGLSRVWRYRCRRNNDPATLVAFPGVAHTEAAQARAGVFSGKIFGDRRPLYRIEDYGHRKWVLNNS